MLNGTTYRTPEFWATKLNDKWYKFASERCAMSWRQRVQDVAGLPKPDAVLGFRSGTLLQDFKTGTVWYVDGSMRRQIDFDAWQDNGFSWDEVVVCSRKELELHPVKGNI